MPSVLVIEDDLAFRRELVKLLARNGFAAREAATGKRGIAEAVQSPPDLVILDLGLPGIGGQEVCRSLKEQVLTAGIPILILTGEDRAGLEISCLDLGADDYLTKPPDGERLLARCRALLRRTQGSAEAARVPVRLGDLELDFPGKTAILAGRKISHLTAKEFGLLYDLALRSPEPSDRARLYREVWGMEPPSEGSLKTVDVHVSRIRLKLGWTSDPWLVTVTGRGYALIPPSAPR
ncbi:MAG: response regulator transcription factor [Elusimicrobia bacterium]|nr:response regulator transcription factor [Elusimicrobiota bacterium]